MGSSVPSRSRLARILRSKAFVLGFKQSKILQSAAPARFF